MQFPNNDFHTQLFKRRKMSRGGGAKISQILRAGTPSHPCPVLENYVRERINEQRIGELPFLLLEKCKFKITTPIKLYLTQYWTCVDGRLNSVGRHKLQS